MTTGETTELVEAIGQLGERLDACKRNEAGVPQSLTDHAIEIVLTAYAKRGRELELLRAIAGGGRCVECGQVESITADGRLAPHHDAGTDELCVGSDERGHEPPNLTVRVLDNDDRRELERLRAMEQRAEEMRDGEGWSWEESCAARFILGESAVR